MTVRRYDAVTGTHVHDHVQVLWALHGTLDMEVEGRGMTLAPGGALRLLPGERHDFESPEGCRCLVLDTHDAFWERRPARPRDALAAHHLAVYLAHTLAAPGSSPVLGALLLARDWGLPAAARRPRRHLEWGALSDWVLGNLHRPLTAADLAARALLSESQFRQRCIEELGCAPMQWVRALRLEHARMLRTTLSIAETARRCGYRSPSALQAALKRAEIR
ncbi:hypothetical protein BW247_10195 [Acidihalobacter ferrooxydans]|uniref:HTH araC/xylS-type domain-containing protein n=1 Tax=Acidihalobacter ferrooxydans TaxID=1765967 RepID=A0A1P8ULD8_9GAMM|nr:hypothetical protein BW247_10195 [Acidihalobacter ferrooxydans]